MFFWKGKNNMQNIVNYAGYTQVCVVDNIISLLEALNKIPKKRKEKI
jgi:hypothetical protein